MSDEPVPGVVVAGMHRSSTSLVTSAFVACGYHLAPDQLAAAPDNPKGYFEDEHMHALHRRMLEAYDTAWDLSPRLRELRTQELAIPEHLHDEVTELVDYYRAHAPWVWKNPRATLFLEDWARWLPEATFVICVRSPAAVVDSMLRRNDRMRISNRRSFYRTRRLFRGLSIWRSYNLMAYRFARRHRDRVVVVRVPTDLATVQAACGSALIEPGLLKPARLPIRLAATVALRCHWLHWRLRRLADPERVRELLGAPRQRRPADAGQATLAAVLRMAASIAASTLVDVGVNAAT